MKAAKLAALLLLTCGRLVGASCAQDKALGELKAAAAESRTAVPLYNLAAAYYNRGCWAEAQRAFEACLSASGPSAPEELRFGARAALGALRLQFRGDPGGAAREFKAALELRPSDLECLRGLAQALQKSGRDEQALEAWNEALRAAPGDPAALYGRALCLNRLDAGSGPKSGTGTLRQAFAEAAAAAESRPGSLRREEQLTCYARLGEIDREAGQLDSALSWLEKAVVLEPNDFNTQFILGQVRYQLRDYAAMLEAYRRALDLRPQHRQARFNLAVALLNLERYAEALEQFKAMQALEPSDKELRALAAESLERAVDQLLGRGAAQLTAEEYGQARASFAKVLELDPAQPAARSYLAAADARAAMACEAGLARARQQLAAGRDAAALRELDAVLRLNPGHTAALALKAQVRADASQLAREELAAGEAAARQGDESAAETAWKQAAGHAPDAAQARRKLANLQRQRSRRMARLLEQASAAAARGALPEARSAYRAALELDPTQLAAINGLARVNDELRKVVLACLDSGRSAERGGDTQAARRAYLQALDLDPGQPQAEAAYARLAGQASPAQLKAERVRQLYYRGVDEYVNNRSREAIAAWRELLKLEPGHAEAQRNIQRAQAKLKALARL